MFKEGFIKGINYWPSRKAMYWWNNFDNCEVELDFRQLSAFKFNTVRIFLLWEDFQPHPDQISALALDHLQITADIAARNKLKIIPTFFVVI